MAVLVVGEHDGAALKAATLSAVTAAQKIGGGVSVLVAGSGCGPVAQAAAKVAGIDRVLVADDPLYANPLAENVAKLVVSLAGQFSHLLAGADSFGKNVMPRVAALLDVAQVSDIMAVEGPKVFVRPIYAGNALQTITDNQPRHILTVRASAFRAAAGGNAAPIETIESPTSSVARLIATHRTESDTPDLSTAQIVVGGGIALGSAENFQLIERLAKKLNAAIGATRAAVDAGYAPNDWQVGQTGKIIAPDLYIAIGISGALQHLAGIQGAKKIVAINSDPEAPLVKLADAALIGDLFEIIPQLIDELDKTGTP